MVAKNWWMIAGLTASLIGQGCERQGNFKTASQIKEANKAAGKSDHHGDHDHGAGPHGGQILELGDDEYHAEVVFDGKAQALKVYLLGKDAKTAAPVAATEVVVTAEGDKKLSLKAAPQEGDGEGKASLFELTDEAAVEPIVKAGFLHGSLQIEVDGKPYRGDDIDIHLDGSEHDDHADRNGEKPKGEEHPADPAPAKNTGSEK